MKNISKVLLIIITILFTNNTETNAQGLILGAKVGANINSTQGAHLLDDYKGYFLIGGYLGIGFEKMRIKADVHFTKNSITTGKDFVQAFSNYISSSASQLYEGNFKTEEIAIPITLGIRIIPNLLWFDIGIQYSSIMSINDGSRLLQDAESVFSKGYMSGVIGLEVQLPLNLNLGARYLHGFSNINNTTIPEHWNTNNIQLHLGLSLFK
jgi:hypothetical protein